MKTNLLTDTQIKKLKIPDTYSDGEGMHLEVTDRGAKLWRFRFRLNGKYATMSFGSYPQVTLIQARSQRTIAREFVAQGIHPNPKKRIDEIKDDVKQETITDDDWNTLHNKYQNETNAKKIQELKQKLFNNNTTFKQWTEYYLVKVRGDVTETHLNRSIKGWRNDVYPVIGNMKMNNIKARDIITILHTMSDRGAKESAKKVFSSISRVFDIAIANFPDDVERNPTKDITLKDVVGKTTKKSYPIITEKEALGALLVNIDNYSGHISTKLALKLISHTFVRPFNIRHAEWSEFNSKTKQWIIPAHKMKTKKEHIVPLSKQVMQIVSEAKKHSGDSIYLFPSPKGVNTPLSENTLVSALRTLGYTKEQLVAHSFRGIFSTLSHEAKVYGHDVIETQLAHSVGSSVSQAYNRAKHIKERTEMMQWYSDLLVSYTK